MKFLIATLGIAFFPQMVLATCLCEYRKASLYCDGPNQERICTAVIGSRCSEYSSRENKGCKEKGYNEIEMYSPLFVYEEGSPIRLGETQYSLTACKDVLANTCPR